MSFITLPDVILRQVLSMLTGVDRNALVLAYPELPALDRSVASLWLDASSRPILIARKEAQMECHKFFGPYTDAMLLKQLCRWYGFFSLKLINNEFHGEDHHPEEFQRLGSLQSNFLP